MSDQWVESLEEIPESALANLYAYVSWQVGADLIETTLYTVEGKIVVTLSEEDTLLLLERIFVYHPQWRRKESNG